jgi:Fic/DOC family
MNVAGPTPFGTLTRVTATSRAHLSRQAKSGEAIRIAAGLYAVGARLPLASVVRHFLLEIVATEWPGAVICGRSAFAGGVPRDGMLFVSRFERGRMGALALEGVTVVPVSGPQRLPGDMSMPHGLAMSGPARALLENVDVPGRRSRSRSGTAIVEDRIDELARSGGAGRVRAVLEELDGIAEFFEAVAVESVRSRLKAVLGSFSTSLEITSPRLGARLSGSPYDARRIEMLEGLVAVLDHHPPQPRAASNPMTSWEWVAFFEAYFSNFIEGTEFGVAEARRIAVEGVVPVARPADAHDVAATYRLANDSTDRTSVPQSGVDLIAQLKSRHRALMAARLEMRPGELKVIPNYAGGYQFVEPALVEGTLIRGFDVLKVLRDPFARSVATMALVTESHPFNDGNGRVARLTANALSVAGQVRIVIPTVYRNNYLAGLTGFSNRAGRGESLVAILDHAQKWTAAIDWSTYAGADEMLERCNAYLDPDLADATGQRLRFPGPLP